MLGTACISQTVSPVCPEPATDIDSPGKMAKPETAQQ